MGIKSLTEETFDLIKKESLCLVYFWAAWSGPCLNYSVLNELEKENPTLSIYKVNVEENPELIKKLSIIVVPTLVFFKNGKQGQTLIGCQNIQTLRDKLTSLRG